MDGLIGGRPYWGGLIGAKSFSPAGYLYGSLISSSLLAHR
jgi:hypothetical protein